jgi:hypothetical protein
MLPLVVRRKQSSVFCDVTPYSLAQVYRSVKRNAVLHNLYSSPSIIRMIKSRRMRWAGHVARPRLHTGIIQCNV